MVDDVIRVPPEADVDGVVDEALHACREDHAGLDCHQNRKGSHDLPYLARQLSEFCSGNPQGDGPSGRFRRGDRGTKIAMVTQRDAEFIQVRAAGA